MSKLEDRAMSTKKGKRIRKSKQSLKDLWYAFKHNNIPLQESKNIKAKIFPDVMKNINLQIQAAQ